MLGKPPDRVVRGPGGRCRRGCLLCGAPRLQSSQNAGKSVATNGLASDLGLWTADLGTFRHAMPPLRRLKPYPGVPSAPRSAGEPAHRDWELVIHGDLTEKQTDLVGHMLEVPRRSRGIIFFDSSKNGQLISTILLQNQKSAKRKVEEKDYFQPFHPLCLLDRPNMG